MWELEQLYTALGECTDGITPEGRELSRNHGWEGAMKILGLRGERPPPLDFAGESGNVFWLVKSDELRYWRFVYGLKENHAALKHYTTRRSPSSMPFGPAMLSSRLMG